MNFIKKYLDVIKAVAVLALLAGLVLGYFAWHAHVFAQGEAATQAKWDAAEKKRAEAEKAAVLKREQENEAERENNRETNRQIQKAHDAELDRVRAALSAQRLRVGTAICGEPARSTQAGGTSGSNGADTEGRLVREDVDRDIKSLALEVEAAFAAGRACQAFVRASGMEP